MTSRRRATLVVLTSLAALPLAFRGGAPAPVAAEVVPNTAACPQGSVAGDGVGGVVPGCELLGGPESAADVNRYSQWLEARNAAPFGQVQAGAYAAALAQRNALAVTTAGNPNAAWEPVGKDALLASDTSYGPNVDGWGNLAGRTSGFAYDPATAGRYFQSFVSGGVWESRDAGAHWSTIGDGLPTQVIGAIAWSTANGGTLIAGSGDNATGRYSTEGVSIYYTTNDGGTWNTSSGLPVGMLTFRIAVDPSSPATIYAATSKGLFRSTDGAASFTNVNLPLPNVSSDTGTYNCTGNTGTDYRCEFANMVTDVVVRPDGGTNGKVLATIGWKYGRTGYRNELTNAIDSTIPQSPQNGVYVSPSGAPSTFAFVSPTTSSFPPITIAGRTALGIADGAGQNHDIVYAVVQDANKYANGCVDFNDQQLTCSGSTICPVGALGCANNTYLDGIYVTSNFGTTWTRLADALALQAPADGSALAKDTVLGNDGVGPGYQAWYNEWIVPDPTQTDPVTGAPLRVLFGLEEVWENQTPGPQNGTLAPETFKVVGRYWNSCTGLAADPIAQPCTGNPPAGSTTHPDQHAAMLVPDGSGGVTLVAGNDGGAFIQHSTGLTDDFSNLKWGATVGNNVPSGNNFGAHTLLPYAVSVAKDGSVLAGLQDNGTMLIKPDGTQQMVYGGDGFFTAIDPDNPNNQLEEYVGGRVSVSADGGHTYGSKDPSQTNSAFGTTAQFSTPLQEDPLQAAHVLIGSRYIMDTTSAYTNFCAIPSCTLITTALEWTQDYDLGQDGGAFRSSTAVDLNGANAYAGWCSNCYTNAGAPFTSGVSTNVGGSQAPAIGSGAGWHTASAIGLPHRVITSIRMDPSDPNTVYVTLGTYLPRYIPADALGVHPDAGSGHVFKSTDHGEHFTDITNNLPNAPANWSVIHNGQLVVATNVGVFVSSDTNGGTYSRLGTNLPVVPVFQMQLQPGSPDVLYAATFGRGVYRYDFAGPDSSIPEFPAGIAIGVLLILIAGVWMLRRRQTAT